MLVVKADLCGNLLRTVLSGSSLENILLGVRMRAILGQAQGNNSAFSFLR